FLPMDNRISYSLRISEAKSSEKIAVPHALILISPLNFLIHIFCNTIDYLRNRTQIISVIT
ncbi:MAG: hypothetical protein IKB28_02150, partial [Clostridia bacterium]|nr:hypothetical protein [Clostridia bacterium]